MKIVKRRFITWLLSLTLILRCFVIALLVHVALLLSLGAIKVGQAVYHGLPSGIFKTVALDPTPIEPEVRFRQAEEKPFGVENPPVVSETGGGMQGASPIVDNTPTLLKTIGVESDFAASTHQRFAGNFTGITPPATVKGSSLLIRSGMGQGIGHGMGWRPGLPDGRGDGRPSQKPPQDTEDAVLAGLRWLKVNQNSDGSWDCRASKSAGTALAVLAFLGHGELPESKEFGPTVQRGLQYLLASVEDTGLVKDKNMYAQGAVTLALAEGYALTSAPAIKDTLKRCINAILLSQKSAKKRDDHGGGWRYTASSADSDTSVSGWMIMALKSAHLAGLEVPKESFQQAAKYLWNVYDDEGGFGYTEPKRSPNMTGVGVLCQQFLGHGRDPRLAKALTYLTQYKMSWDDTAGNWVLYGWYYTTQAMFQAGGAHWRTWEKQLRPTMVAAQAKDGSWGPPIKSKSEGDSLAYTTALSCLILEVYYRYLPIYQEMERRPGATTTTTASSR